MRVSMVGTGLVIAASGLVLWQILGYPIWITGAITSFNILLGIITPRSRKVDLQPEPSGRVKLVVDKVVLRTGKFTFNNYELVFLDTKLVMKKLVSWKLVFAVGAFFLAVGGFVGALTEWSVQGFLEQRKRDGIRDGNAFTTVSSGDMEIPYESMSQVRLTGLSLIMSVGGRVSIFSMGTEYPPMIARRLKEIIPNQCWAPPGSVAPYGY